MLTYASTTAWVLWRRHHVGFSVVLGWMAAVAVPHLLLPAGSLSLAGAGLGSFGFALTFMYTVAVFSLALDAAVDGRTSCFPSRMFTLPVSTSTLVLWPMLYGTMAVAAVWVVVAECILKRNNIGGAPAWPIALVFATYLAWFQAVTWSPFPMAGLRVVVIVFLMASIIFVPPLTMHALHYVPESALTWLVWFLLAGAYGVAYRSVSRARHGTAGAWSWPGTLTGWVWSHFLRRREGFVSAAQAQLWLEWRVRGNVFLSLIAVSLVMIVPGMSCFELLERDIAASGLVPVLPGLSVEAHVTVKILGNLLCLLILIATATGVQASTPLMRTRPMTEAALVGVKIRFAVWSSLLGWFMVLCASGVWLMLGHMGASLREVRQVWLADYSSLEVAAVLVLGLLGTLVLTWIQMVQGLFIGLSGRGWFEMSAIALAIGTLAVLAIFGKWLWLHPEHQPAFWTVFPWLVGTLLLLKVMAGCWTLRTVLRRRLVTVATLQTWLGAWLAAVASTIAVLFWLVPVAVSRPLLATGVILVFPLARLAAAPLALAWNRHR